MVLVIGGAGFIGSHLVDELLVQRFEVAVVDDLSTGKLENIFRWKGHGKLEFVRADVKDKTIAQRMVDHKNWVFNFAPMTFKELQQLYICCVDAGVRRVIDNTGEDPRCPSSADFKSFPAPISLRYGTVYGPRGSHEGDVFVSDIVRLNMMAAMNHEVTGVIDVKDTLYWAPKITQEQGAEIIRVYEKNAHPSLIIASR
jgi:NAD(P)-dependent dehydrogenase (short-subunit alcohol dehydrogenase family)